MGLWTQFLLHLVWQFTIPKSLHLYRNDLLCKFPKRGVLCHKVKISILTSPSTSEQSPLCSDVFLFPWQKRRHPPASLLLLSKSQPLCWVVIWFWVQTWSLGIYTVAIYPKRSTCELISPIGTQCGPMGLNAVYGENRGCGTPHPLFFAHNAFLDNEQSFEFG